MVVSSKTAIRFYLQNHMNKYISILIINFGHFLIFSMSHEHIFNIALNP